MLAKQQTCLIWSLTNLFEIIKVLFANRFSTSTFCYFHISTSIHYGCDEWNNIIPTVPSNVQWQK